MHEQNDEQNDEQNNMQDTDLTNAANLSKPSRRRWLQVTGGAAVALPVLGMAGCSGDDAKSAADSAASSASNAANSAKEMAGDAAAGAKSMAGDAADKAKEMAGDAADKAKGMASDASDKMTDMANDATESAKSMVPGSGELVKITLDDPSAKALSYTEDATQVDTSKHPRFAAGQNCGNCGQYKATEGGWGSCAIFPGKLVAEAAWCAGYIAKG